jgi:uncharacterized lipoprotein NlpE involved in copper resistance
MKADIKIPFLILLILTILGCQNSDKKEKQLVQKVYGNLSTINDSLGVELELDRFNN